MKVSRRLAKYDFALTNTGGTSQTVTLPPHDFSMARTLVMQITLTSVGNSDAGDTLNLYLQDTRDGVTWNDRIASHQFTGAMSVSSTAPEVRRYIIQSDVLLSSDEEAYETTGSAGAARLTAGIGINGPFYPPTRGSTGRVANWRLSFEFSDADSDADWSGNITIFAESEI